MKQLQNYCLKCKRFGNIANKKHMLCFRCNSIRLHYDKINKQKDNNTYESEVELYRQIWSKREHKCELTGEDVEWTFGTDIWFSCFAHIFPKSKHPQWKFLDINIMIVHPDVHYAYDYGTQEQLRNRIGEKGLRKLFNKKKKVLEYKKGQ
jgi:hypothetical protein